MKQNIKIQNVDKIQNNRCLNLALETYIAGHGGNFIFVGAGQNMSLIFMKLK